MTVQDAVQEFLLQKRVEGLQKKSVESYDCNLKIFVAFIGANVDIEGLAWDQVSAYILDLYGSSRSRATVSSYIRDLKVFLRWVSGEYSLSFNYAKVKVPKSPKKNVKIYSDDEILQIFALCQASVPWITARNRAIIAFCLDSGLRQCEIINMQRSDIFYQLMIVKVTGKGAKDRMVPMGSVTLSLLLDYLQLCPYDSAAVFLGRRGQPMTSNAIRQFMSKLQRQLPFSLSSHRLRHNFATNFCIDHLKKSGSSAVYDLSILMGHESIETTKRYEHFAHEIIAAGSNISHLDGIPGFSKK